MTGKPTASSAGKHDDSKRLRTTLQRVFGHAQFRPHQQTICEAIVEGRDALVVMPTGAGKSLCYQLPGLVRAGPTIVISPLIALMEDQVAKMQALGLRAEAWHSGRARPDLERLRADYAAGSLDFLFVAPERLGVPGFVAWLAQTPPALVAIDEAHCVSQWGHDFRPDYRMLDERLAPLRNTPRVALTATATPRVQRDIIDKLALHKPKPFIFGFRRDNIAIEAVEVGRAERPAAVMQVLGSAENLPAIVYAPSRKQTEALAEELKRLPDLRVEAYHAGLPAQRRDTIQRGFLSGQLDVIVATVAFGMGVDKADIRTVLHLALPSSIEGYYQEIGRAGRDGEPSRAILLHGYGDTQLQNWFFERSYPPSSVLRTVVDACNTEGLSQDDLKERAGLADDLFARAYEQLWIHGGLSADAQGLIRPGERGWQRAYDKQRDYREGQLSEMQRYAHNHDCRMRALVTYFGDQADSGAACGLCDRCAPQASIALPRERPSSAQSQQLAAILRALGDRGEMAVGRLFRENLPAGFARNTFETWLAALAQAELIYVIDDSFSKDGKEINYRKAVLTKTGRRAARDTAMLGESVWLPIHNDAPKRPSPRKPRPSAASLAGTSTPSHPVPPGLLLALKQWRKSKADELGVPAFRIMGNTTLEAIAAAQPRNTQALLAVKGIGPKLAESYGHELLMLFEQAR